MARPRRLFVPELLADGGRIELPRESVEHAQVLRITQGAQVCLFDARGSEAQAQVVSIDRGRMTCDAAAPCKTPPPAVALTLLLAVPKAGRLETVVRMTTELGVSGIRLGHSQRSVPKLSSDSPKIERLRRVAREACAQSGNARAPEVFAPEPLLQVAGQAPAAARKLVFWELATETLDAALADHVTGTPCEVWAVVGPEGGLAVEEVAALQALGYQPVGLGDAILRVDTAAVVVAALLLDRLQVLRS
ncbi:MAG TPA: RsmE family RNA methyltransferase [Polyangiales bacterium]